MLSIGLASIVLAASSPVASSHWRPGVHNAKHAIVGAWCPTNRFLSACALHGQGKRALRIAACETGGTFSPWARNGQYLGLFQMGRWARQTYGHGIDPWSQARAAWRYWRAQGKRWRPGWECAYIVGIP